MEDLSIILTIFFILLGGVFIGVILGLTFLVNKSKKQAEQSEANIARMVNSLPQEDRVSFFLQINNVRKNPTTAVLLALLLGGFGAHKFYLNQTVLGIVYLLFSWTTIPWWIALYDAISLGGITSQYNERKAREYFRMFSKDQKTEVVLLEMRGITKRFPGVVANENVDLHLKEGEVLALLGENGAGKSTLMNILVGLYRQDEGEIYVRGEPVQINSPRDSYDLGIGMVHQNFMLVPTMTVAENIVLGLVDLSLVPDMQKIIKRIRDLSEQYHLKVDPTAKIWQLSVGEQQRVEILKLIYRGAEILILDEPTAVLTPQESHELQEVLKIMAAEEKSAIFITHKMEEVMEFSDRVMVLQNGKLTATRKTSETSPNELARLMVGRDVLFRLEKDDIDAGETVLELKNVKVKDDRGLPALDDVSLTIRSGEILGIAGVAGNGQDQLAEVITGLRNPNSGKVLLSGKDVTKNTPLGMIKSGVSHIPADRMRMGTVGSMQVSENLVMKGYRNDPISTGGIIRPKKIHDFAKRMIEAFRIATPSPKTRVKFLSGGNIQKTILAREIDACDELMVAVYPSRGLDVGATESVRNMLLEQRQEGIGVLLISEDLDELTSIADRIAVMFEGKIMGTIDSADADIEKLGLMMSGTRLENLQEEA